ncbi:MFS transporter [Streptomyces sp. NPDC059524]|uniref:MFS transporter n=1 Tax=Streptomyces sp. NPDC059524 TaxID=3346856 RepID=UPI00367CE4A9
MTGPSERRTRGYAWVVFGLSFGLLLSDYMSRQVLNAVFPLLKAEWMLSDAQLGSLSGIVALMVGVLTFPLSLLADRWGRVRSLVLAAVVWSLATLGCAVAASYGQMFLGRFMVGVGEAAYGSVGVAVVISVFPATLRATLSGAFIAGGAFGSVLGVSIGGVIAQHLGWRWTFAIMGLFGLVLAAVYSVVVTERRLARACREQGNPPGAQGPVRSLLPRLFSSVSVRCAYIGSGLQMFLAMSLLAWMPSYLDRSYGLSTDKAGLVAGIFALITGIGMIGGGLVSDRLGRRGVRHKWTLAVLCSTGSLVLLGIGFQLPTGIGQLLLIGGGTLLSNATAGPAAAMVVSLTPPAVVATSMATLTLANSLIGLAPGPAVTGMLADHIGLHAALGVIPFVSLGAALAFALGRRHYAADLLPAAPAAPRTKTELPT